MGTSEFNQLFEKFVNGACTEEERLTGEASAVSKSDLSHAADARVKKTFGVRCVVEGIMIEVMCATC